MQEEWRDVPGYEGLYQVSNTGKVKRLARDVISVTHYPEAILCGEVDQDGYCRVAFSVSNPANYGLELPVKQSNGKKGLRHFVKKQVHRMVYEAFCEPIPEGMHINHLDCNRSNNLLSNLEVVTPQENVDYSFEFGRRARSTQKRRPIADRLTEPHNEKL